jgi:hypothetical protein
MKDKSVTFGITMLVAADTVSACCVNFEICWEKMTAINRTSGLSSRVVIELTKFLEKKTMSILVRNWSTISSLVIPTSAVLSEPTERDFQSHLLNLKLNKGDFKEVILIGLCVGILLEK